MGKRGFYAIHRLSVHVHGEKDASSFQTNLPELTWQVCRRKSAGYWAPGLDLEIRRVRFQIDVVRVLPGSGGGCQMGPVP